MRSTLKKEKEDSGSVQISQMGRIVQTQKGAFFTGLTEHEIDELKRIEDVVAKTKKPRWPPEVCDPLFVGVRELFYGDDCKRSFTLASHFDDGILIFTEEDRSATTPS